jgi:hypothetical protein
MATDSPLHHPRYMYTPGPLRRACLASSPRVESVGRSGWTSGSASSQPLTIAKPPGGLPATAISRVMKKVVVFCSLTSVGACPTSLTLRLRGSLDVGACPGGMLECRSDGPAIRTTISAHCAIDIFMLCASSWFGRRFVYRRAPNGTSFRWHRFRPRLSKLAYGGSKCRR